MSHMRCLHWCFASDCNTSSMLLSAPCRMIKYDAILDDYTAVASMPAPRSNFASALLNGRGYIIGGFETTNTAARSLPKVNFWCSCSVLCCPIQVGVDGGRE